MQSNKLLPLLALLAAVVLLLAACESTSPTDSGHDTPPDTSGTPGDTTELPPDTTITPPDTLTPDSSAWDSSGIGPEDVDCDMAEMLDRYDPLAAGLGWVYTRTRTGAVDQVDYQYWHLDVFPPEDFLELNIYTSDQLSRVRYGHRDHLFREHRNGEAIAGPTRIWQLFRFCAADAGDTIRWRAHIVLGDTVQAEVVRVTGWQETVELPDTTFTGCYSVVVDTVLHSDSLEYRHTVTDWYAPDVGLVKRVDELSENGVQQSTVLEYKPRSTWPWVYEPPTEPGEPGAAIQSYFPLDEGRQWDYLSVHAFDSYSDSTWIRQRCRAPVPIGEFFFHPREQFLALPSDTADMEERDPQVSEYTYNGNQLLSRYVGEEEWDAAAQFYRFPDVTEGQVLYDSDPSGESTMRTYVQVVALHETVTVPAGTFTDVYVVRIDRHSGHMYPSNSTLREYYAPGVGLVKISGGGYNGTESYDLETALMRYTTGSE